MPALAAATGVPIQVADQVMDPFAVPAQDFSGGWVAIRVRGLRKRYGDVEAVRGIDLTVRAPRPRQWVWDVIAGVRDLGAHCRCLAPWLPGPRHAALIFPLQVLRPRRTLEDIYRF